MYAVRVIGLCLLATMIVSGQHTNNLSKTSKALTNVLLQVILNINYVSGVIWDRSTHTLIIPLVYINQHLNLRLQNWKTFYIVIIIQIYVYIYKWPVIVESAQTQLEKLTQTYTDFTSLIYIRQKMHISQNKISGTPICCRSTNL